MPPSPPRGGGGRDPVLAMLHDFRQEYREGRKELVDEIRSVKTQLTEHSRDDANGFQAVHQDIKDHGERLAKIEANDARDAELRERDFFVPRAASSPQLPTPPAFPAPEPRHKSWIPDALAKRWVQAIALALAIVLGGLLRHCAPGFASALMQPLPAEKR